MSPRRGRRAVLATAFSLAAALMAAGQSDWTYDEPLFAMLGSPADLLVAMEATGHYGRNLFGALADHGLACLRLDSRRRFGAKLARQLIEAARLSVGRHDGPACSAEVQLTCTDLGILRDADRGVRRHPSGRVAAHGNASGLSSALAPQLEQIPQQCS